MAQCSLMRGGGLADAAYCHLWNQQQVDGCGWGDVMDNDAVLVLVLDFRGYLAGDDAFEKGRHG